MTGITGSGNATALMQQLLLQMTGANSTSASATGQTSSSNPASSLFNLDDADSGCETAGTSTATGNIGSAFRMLSTQAQASLLNAQEQSGSPSASATSTASGTSTTAADTSTADNTNNLLQQLSSYKHAHGHHHHGDADPAQTADNSQNSGSSTPTDFASLLQQYASEASGSATTAGAQDQLLSVVA